MSSSFSAIRARPSCSSPRRGRTRSRRRVFARRLAESSIAVSALVVNRLFPNFGSQDPPLAGLPGSGGGAEPVSVDDDPLAYEELRRNLGEFLAVSTREERYVSELALEVAPAPVVRVPFLEEDVHDLDGLKIVARHLLKGN